MANLKSTQLKLVVAILILAMSSNVAYGSEKPNILILIADDLGWNDVGYHGSKIATPNINQIAADGVELDRFYVQPTCSPTRAALMTGKSPISLGVIRPINKNAAIGLPLEEKLLPEYLGEMGYQRFLVGKWHLGNKTQSQLPNARGFEHSYGSLTGGVGYWNKVHGGGYDWHRNGQVAREKGYVTHLLVKEVRSLLKARDKTRPNFMYVAFQAPHLPNEAPKKTIEKYKNLTKERAIHAAMVDELDQAIGQIINAYEDQGILKNTIVFFMSDNGGLVPPSSNPKEHSKTQHLALTLASILGRPAPSFPVPGIEFFISNFLDGASDNSPLAGGKTMAREGGVRVPAAIRFPEKLIVEKYGSPFTVSDVLPTLFEAIGEEGRIPLSLQGKSQWKGLNGGLSEKPDYVVADLIDGFSIYHWPWKLINNEQVELYQIMKDPLEQRNLASTHPNIVTDLRQRLANWQYQPDSGIPWSDVFFDPDTFGGEENRAPWVETIKD